MDSAVLIIFYILFFVKRRQQLRQTGLNHLKKLKKCKKRKFLETNCHIKDYVYPCFISISLDLDNLVCHGCDVGKGESHEHEKAEHTPPPVKHSPRK